MIRNFVKITEAIAFVWYTKHIKKKGGHKHVGYSW